MVENKQETKHVKNKRTKEQKNKRTKEQRTKEQKNERATKSVPFQLNLILVQQFL